MENSKESENKCKRKKGDENMGMTNTNMKKLDINYILTHGKQISSQEALTDIIPINWNSEVINGKYKNKTIIKSKDGKDK